LAALSQGIHAGTDEACREQATALPAVMTFVVRVLADRKQERNASWLNLVERLFGLLTEHALRRGSHKSSRELRSAIQDYLDAHNDEPKPFRWTKTADEILASIARFATRTSTAHPGEAS